MGKYVIDLVALISQYRSNLSDGGVSRILLEKI